MKLNITCAFLFLVSSFTQLSGQTSFKDLNSATKWSIFWNGSQDLSRPNFNGSTFAVLGIGVRAQRIFKSGIGVEARLSYRNWSDLHRTMLPFYIGPSYTLMSNDKFKLLLRSGLGPAGILGNDYGSFFFSYDVGSEYQLSTGNGHALIVGVAFSQGMAFHPDHFEFIDFTLGWQF